MYKFSVALVFQIVSLLTVSQATFKIDNIFEIFSRCILLKKYDSL